MKVLFACGGSGGHITPAIAMAEIIKKHFPSAECAFVGNENGMERRMAYDGGYLFYPIKIEGLHRSLSFRNFRTLLLAARAPARARQILKEFAPALVIGTGGYVSYPMIPAAKKLGIPTLLYEPNAIPGLSVRMTEKHADLLLLQFEACAARLKHRERTRVIGAPLRTGFTQMTRSRARAHLGFGANDFIVLCFGGSLGAECISTAATESFSRLEKQGITLIHATGKRLFEGLKARYPKEVREGKLLPYIDDMPTYMAAANVIVSRAGAMTLAEISRIGRAAVLIPSPYVAENHQEKNALLYEKRGAALLVKEAALTPDSFSERILFLKQNPALLSRMEKNASAVGVKNSEECFLASLNEIL
ncbi:MAG: undecaprenyldiphospho-muramoylpentapeptide beta-N-acetylglucosaminyltransferase [Ruminococcaceae bacterium]|nr:undecaprenyldiphospho-muramoylpentapeptide beta-N-acetylglucosaminyltransferase [Oscillospiraceae bacterium]